MDFNGYVALLTQWETPYPYYLIGAALFSGLVIYIGILSAKMDSL